MNPAADSAMLDILAHNEDGTMLQRWNEVVTAPHKTGSTDSVRTECAYFPLQSRVVACVMTKGNEDTRYAVDNEAQVMMAGMGRLLVHSWPKRP